MAKRTKRRTSAASKQRKGAAKRGDKAAVSPAPPLKVRENLRRRAEWFQSRAGAPKKI